MAGATSQNNALLTSTSLSTYMTNSAWLRKRCITLGNYSLALLITTLSGCSNIHCCFSYERKDNSGSTFFIVGLGLVTLPATHDDKDILVANTKSLGLAFLNQPGIQASLGYMNSSVVSIPSNQDTITEVKTCPIDNKTINVQVLKTN